MAKMKVSFWAITELLLPWFVLIFLAVYSAGVFSFMPYAGVQISTNKITRVFSSTVGSSGLQQEDVLLRVGTVTAEQVAKDLRQGFFQGQKVGDTVEVVVDRKGQQVTLQYTLPFAIDGEIFNRVESQWFIPYIFWIAGTAVLFFLRPRSLLRLLLALFSYLTAIWLSASSLSARHFWDAALLLRCAVWLSAPVYFHLHWQFPSPLRRLSNWAWVLLYAVCAVMAVFSWLQVVPQSFYLIGFIFMIAGSVILLVVHLIVQPEERRKLIGLVAALGIVLLPALGFGILGILGVGDTFAGLSVLGLAALPGFYFFTLFRRQLNFAQEQRADRLVRVYVEIILVGLLFCSFLVLIAQSWGIYKNIYLLDTLAVILLTVISLVNFVPFLVLPALANETITLAVIGPQLRFSANRAASGVIFILIATLTGMLIGFLIQQVTFSGVTGVGLLVGVLTSASIVLLGYPGFRRFFEHSVLGMPLAPEGLSRTYAARITTSLEKPALGRLLLDEVMPSLLVRQFVQLENKNGALVPGFRLRVEAEMLPGAGSRAALDSAAGRELAAEQSALPAWIRLVIPLRAASEVRGFWLLGRRDPDDHYSPEDIAMFQALADQTALALINIEQSEALRALYFADIERNEGERLQMAAELHDDVLNQLAVLNLNLRQAEPVVLQAYDQAVFHIRQIINGLRPAMLDHGLHTAIATLVDELNDRLAAQEGAPRVVLEVPAAEVRYDPRVDLSIYRITQQACSNAIQHAHCQTIHISGELLPEQAGVTIRDDGRGFAAGEQIDLPGLLRNKHFGVAGMFERAALIDAQLEIDSRPGQGCTVNLRWVA